MEYSKFLHIVYNTNIYMVLTKKSYGLLSIVVYFGKMFIWGIMKMDTNFL